MTRLRLTPGIGTTLQDAGRVGYARLGVPRSGPMDPLHHRLALGLVGQGASGGDVALEVGPGGAVLRAGDDPLVLAVAGPSVRLVTGGVTRVTAVEVLSLAAGATITISCGPGAMWAYVAIAGVVTSPSVLGSRSQHPRSGLGMLDGPQWELDITCATDDVVLGTRPPLSQIKGRFGVLEAPQTQLFSRDVRALLTTGMWQTTTTQDRMGHRLTGPLLRCAAGHDIVSDGVLPGSLQLPGDGQLFVLTADHQTTGGYPKLAVMAAADLARFVQLPVGSDVAFSWIEPAEAATRWSAAVDAVDAIIASPARPTSASLTAQNLISGVTQG